MITYVKSYRFPYNPQTFAGIIDKLNKDPRVEEITVTNTRAPEWSSASPEAKKHLIMLAFYVHEKDTWMARLRRRRYAGNVFFREPR